MKMMHRCENLQSQPRGRLKSLRTIAPDPRRWSGWQGPAAHARRAGGAGCEDSALTRRAGGPRAQGYERVVRQRRSLASCARTAATVPWVPCDSTACERNRALPPRPRSPPQAPLPNDLDAQLPVIDRDRARRAFGGLRNAPRVSSLAEEDLGMRCAVAEDAARRAARAVRLLPIRPRTRAERRRF